MASPLARTGVNVLDIPATRFTVNRLIVSKTPKCIVYDSPSRVLVRICNLPDGSSIYLGPSSAVAPGADGAGFLMQSYQSTDPQGGIVNIMDMPVSCEIWAVTNPGAGATPIKIIEFFNDSL